MIYELPVRNWAKSLAFDCDIEKELDKAKITCAFPNQVIHTDWVIKRILIYKTQFDRKVLTILAHTKIDGEDYTQHIRLYSPWLPNTKNLEQYLNAKITGMNLICSVRTSSSQVLVAHFIRTIKSDGKKSNPIIQTEENMSPLLNGKVSKISTDDFQRFPAMTDDQMLDQYYDQSKKSKYLI